MQEHRAYIGFGSNLGDRLHNCRLAIETLSNASGVTLVKTSSFYQTSPVGMLAQPTFVNGVALLGLQKDAHWLLHRMLAIEKDMGRVRQDRWGPRIIDLDLLFFDELVIDTAELTVPHPRLHQRRFVLLPLKEIAPQLRHPLLNHTVTELLENLDAPEQRVELMDIR
ncbi:MAG: 2-amino-4-hydroxy-6-hydroxymethyldihydropteridine diphosphokinase [Deltaproteobacteria bacterium]|nr:2-amino-4-hydroxy-6-hydroxymethyldihydropteridine diphosphokinase [Deltaproteobacteria bacterium]MBW2071905.1 2-amino-4-hydroxy-6-hydroxymethyldihydropteridine diphosphokinase [Deltaproteobacteria bacterium]